MNPEQYLSVVEQLILNRPLSGIGKWALVWQKEKLALVSEAEYHTFDEKIAVITAVQAQTGFSTKEWNELKRRLADFLSRKGLL